MKSLIGKKIGMTTLFTKERVIPVTVIEAGPCYVLDRKTLPRDGYEALKIGYKETRERSLAKPVAGVCKKAGAVPLKIVREFRLKGKESDTQIGAKLTVELFECGEKVRVRGVSKGKGFQGVMKRHGMAGGPASHGHMSHRRIGSIGCRTTPGKIFKGKRMPGHMGLETICIRGLEVIRIEAERNLLMVRGSVPGPNGGLLIIEDESK
ncbi:MAG: 50S ribosomal protein L3 [Coprothermobacterota bacterium]|nr:50S ribosomal protein L3 [Coprothermobacterota bacterium]